MKPTRHERTRIKQNRESIMAEINLFRKYRCRKCENYENGVCLQKKTVRECKNGR